MSNEISEIQLLDGTVVPIKKPTITEKEYTINFSANEFVSPYTALASVSIESRDRLEYGEPICAVVFGSAGYPESIGYYNPKYNNLLLVSYHTGNMNVVVKFLKT